MEPIAENPSHGLSSDTVKFPPQVIPYVSVHNPIQQHPQSPQTPHNQTQAVSPQARIIFDILAQSPQDLDSALSVTGIQPSPELAKEVLELLYAIPSSAVKFFRWAGKSHKLSALVWNLMVDLLGKNKLFEQMWDAIRSMRQEEVLSLTTFVSVFESYCEAGLLNEATMTFDVMERYGIQPNVVAVNSLLSSICRQGNQTIKAFEFFEKVKIKIPPDGDSFAILLEGWKEEGNLVKAKNTFGEMVIRVGWSPHNVSAYDAFLITLVRGSQIDESIKFLQVMTGKNCFPGLKFFSNALDILIKQNDSSHAIQLWDIMLGCGLTPNLIMYNAIIGLLCNTSDADNAMRLLDEMVFQGAFPDSITYNMIFQCLIKNKKVREVGKFFIEMIKNEWPPTPSNCAAAISMLFDGDDPETATDIWEFMVKTQLSPLDFSANALLIGLCNMYRLSELRRFAAHMLDRRVKVYESTMEKMKNAFYKDRRNPRDRDIYNNLLRKWQSSQLL